MFIIGKKPGNDVTDWNIKYFVSKDSNFIFKEFNSTQSYKNLCLPFIKIILDLSYHIIYVAKL